MLSFHFAPRIRRGLFTIRTRYSHSSNSASSEQFPPGFSFWLDYFSTEEQETLLAASLYKLDATEMPQSRRRRKDYWSSQAAKTREGLGSCTRLFAPDTMYEFEEGHFDGVIHHFREMHLSSWPVEHFRGLTSVLDKLYALCPTDDVLTHLLHLSSRGEILPHVDNLSASGSWILGVSLGDERILRMKGTDNEGKEFSLALPSGSVYLQRDQVRFNYLHSIERKICGESLRGVGHRLSIMIRDRNISSSSIS